MIIAGDADASIDASACRAGDEKSSPSIMSCRRRVCVVSAPLAGPAVAGQAGMESMSDMSLVEPRGLRVGDDGQRMFLFDLAIGDRGLIGAGLPARGRTC